ncbi:transglycosylase SLT domain-containing protein [Staphylococcus intermedius]|uniref:Probable transglycosylase IsaA n=1 Tax=Staphylococcus intermedius NCTC 11048 TaxID=1141106 RepID=A0A380G3R0_STAIN|nr:transglycosylase SLT domain-containing protein [Staphylococcus intermedius]PCF63909.1 transglycosylase [Staphylococcus intermedius]PCF78624.1 transglycosylase [Staphylococcus intermedius]PCF79597.1 transglycosylase [Staphylococcus intermedius]PCF86668.1 transglycosylase [Staphylococcus intermedius]PCF89745.1 transglycosylase [Staphylococcus intermedius]
MKKSLLLTTTLAATIGTGFVASAHDANAAEQNIDQAKLAEMAQHNDPSLNQHPIEEGSYEYNFTLDGVSYSFWSDGVYFGWSYNGFGQSSNHDHASVAQPTQMADVSGQASQQSYSNGPSATQQTSGQAPKQQAAPSYQTASTSTGSVRLANGNTAGSYGTRAAQEMASRTGVPASTWEAIIARESNGQLNARNASGASGLFQTMPGWGSTSTYEGQIAAATKAYNAQGLSAWGM